jgi:hypothetical protein
VFLSFRPPNVVLFGLQLPYILLVKAGTLLSSSAAPYLMTCCLPLILAF